MSGRPNILALAELFAPAVTHTGTNSGIAMIFEVTETITDARKVIDTCEMEGSGRVRLRSLLFATIQTDGLIRQ
jgi:hypothetical protein